MAKDLPDAGTNLLAQRIRDAVRLEPRHRALEIACAEREMVEHPGRIGGGTSLDAPAGTSGFSPRFSFGVSRLNLLGLGHTLSLQTRVSNYEARVTRRTGDQRVLRSRESGRA